MIEPPLRVDANEAPHPVTDVPPRILVTNDDGLDAPGLHHLVRALAPDHDVVVAAPSSDLSGSGTGIGRYDAANPATFVRRDLDGVEAYGLAGPPGLAVMAAALGAFGRRPTLVVSGINPGINTGHSIVHSGTVGAVLTARTFGSSGVAVSLAPSQSWRWETAAAVARAAVEWILHRERRTTLNVNVPALPLEQIKGARWARIDEFGYFRVATADASQRTLQLEVSDRSSGSDPRSDTALCREGYVALTLLSAIEQEPDPSDDPADVAFT